MLSTETSFESPRISIPMISIAKERLTRCQKLLIRVVPDDRFLTILESPIGCSGTTSNVTSLLLFQVLHTCACVVVIAVVKWLYAQVIPAESDVVRNLKTCNLDPDRNNPFANMVRRIAISKVLRESKLAAQSTRLWGIVLTPVWIAWVL